MSDTPQQSPQERQPVFEVTVKELTTGDVETYPVLADQFLIVTPRLRDLADLVVNGRGTVVWTDR